MIVAVSGDGIEHDFIDDDLAESDLGVAAPGCFGLEPIEIRSAVGIAAGGDAVLLTFKADGVEDFRAGRVFQVNRFSGRAEREPHAGLVVSQEPTGWDRHVREDKTIGGRVVGEDTSAQVYGLGAVIVEFDVIQFRIVGVGEEFIDEDGAIGVCGGCFCGPRRSANQVAGVPGSGITFTKRRPGQDQRMAGTVSGCRPGWITRIIHFDQHGSLFVAQSDCARSVG